MRELSSLTMTTIEQQFAKNEQPLNDAGSIASTQSMDALVYMAGSSLVRLHRFIQEHAPTDIVVSETNMLSRRITALRLRSLEFTYFLQQLFPLYRPLNEEIAKDKMLEFCFKFVQEVRKEERA